MSSKKSSSKGHDNSLPKAQRKNHFKDFEALATYAKAMVYLIVRLREVNGVPYWLNLGTGFLVGPHRLMTCYHCIDDEKHKAEMLTMHEDGDVYLFLQQDEEGNYHRVGVTPILDESLFLYRKMDTAIFHLDDSFYRVDQQYHKHPHIYLQLDNKRKRIGLEMGILGYPFPNLTFNEKGEVDSTDVHIRADKGILNTTYEVEGVAIYESTTAFNPGNSGGPILDVKTGYVIGMVHGYRPIPTHWVEDVIPAIKNGTGQDITHHYQLRTTYSVGICSQTLSMLAEKHQLAIA